MYSHAHVHVFFLYYIHTVHNCVGHWEGGFNSLFADLDYACTKFSFYLFPFL